MALDFLQNILDAEREANVALAQAQASAGDLVKNAQSVVREQERRAAVEIRALRQQMLEKKREEIQQTLDSEAAAREKQIADKMDSAEKNLPEAVKMIIEEVLRHGDR